MPIKVKDFTWSESSTHVFISVPLKGVKPGKADIYSNDLYIKVNYPPYIFEADLLKSIDDASSSASIGKGCVEFKLQKREAENWGSLSFQGEKEQIRIRRDRAQADSFLSQEQRKEKELEAKHEREREAVRSQMDRDAQERKRVEDAKDVEKKRMSDAVSALETSSPDTRKSQTVTRKNTEKAIRSTGSITVSFTPRVFRTAARESHKLEEDEWIAKQEQARKAIYEAKKFAEDNGVENDPLWLKDKGNEFFQKGDYQSALNAYTAGVHLDPNMAALYSNRAACHLKLKDWHAAANDASKALSILTPPVDANKRSRLIALSRRAAALVGVEDTKSALLDLTQALSLDPSNVGIQADIARLQGKESPDTLSGSG
eukprot:m.369591 g.369591  ORF g.369591 m.369591 type:complete len:373 (+) comp20853_c0_seq3:282-1400(+)